MTNGLSLNDVAQIIKKKKKLQKVIPFTLYVGITKFSCKYSDANLNSRLWQSVRCLCSACHWIRLSPHFKPSFNNIFIIFIATLLKWIEVIELNFLLYVLFHNCNALWWAIIKKGFPSFGKRSWVDPFFAGKNAYFVVQVSDWNVEQALTRTISNPTTDSNKCTKFRQLDFCKKGFILTENLSWSIIDVT